VRKVACWSTKAAISLKRVTIEAKLLWSAYTNSPTLFRKAPSLTLYGLIFPKIRSSQPPKLQSLLSQERVKLGLRTANLAVAFTGLEGLSKQKPFKNLGEKGAWPLSRDCPDFLSTPYYFRNG